MAPHLAALKHCSIGASIDCTPMNKLWLVRNQKASPQSQGLTFRTRLADDTVQSGHSAHEQNGP